MNSLVLVKSEQFGSAQCDFYSGNDELWMTRDQIGMALEYSEPRKAIQKIHDRYKDRLDRYSVVTKLTTTDGKRYETYLYNAKGVYEICRWSRQPKADAFFDWVYEILEGLRTGKLKIRSGKTAEQKQMELEARLRNSKTRQARLLVNVADKFRNQLSNESIQLLLGEATEIISDHPILPKPNIQKTYTASEIAKMTGCSANAVGRIANQNGLKRPEYGLWILDKSAYSNKQVNSFVYNEAGMQKLIELLQQEKQPQV